MRHILAAALAFLPAAASAQDVYALPETHADAAFDEIYDMLLPHLEETILNMPIFAPDGQGGFFVFGTGISAQAGGEEVADGLLTDLPAQLGLEAAADAVASASGAGIIDDFNRADGAVIGNGWNEVGPGTWDIVSGRARFSGDLTGAIVRADVNRATFDIQGTFRIISPLGDPHSPDLMVNADAAGDNGMSVSYLAIHQFIRVTGPTSNSGFVAVVGTVGVNEDFVLRLQYDGTTLTGSIASTSANGQASLVTANAAGTNIAVGFVEVPIGFQEDWEVDEIRSNQ